MSAIMEDSAGCNWVDIRLYERSPTQQDEAFSHLVRILETECLNLGIKCSAILRSGATQAAQQPGPSASSPRNIVSQSVAQVFPAPPLLPSGGVLNERPPSPRPNSSSRLHTPSSTNNAPAVSTIVVGRRINGQYESFNNNNNNRNVEDQRRPVSAFARVDLVNGQQSQNRFYREAEDEGRSVGWIRKANTQFTLPREVRSNGGGSSPSFSSFDALSPTAVFPANKTHSDNTPKNLANGGAAHYSQQQVVSNFGPVGGFSPSAATSNRIRLPVPQSQPSSQTNAPQLPAILGYAPTMFYSPADSPHLVSPIHQLPTIPQQQQQQIPPFGTYSHEYTPPQLQPHFTSVNLPVMYRDNEAIQNSYEQYALFQQQQQLTPTITALPPFNHQVAYVSQQNVQQPPFISPPRNPVFRTTGNQAPLEEYLSLQPNYNLQIPSTLPPNLMPINTYSQSLPRQNPIRPQSAHLQNSSYRSEPYMPDQRQHNQTLNSNHQLNQPDNSRSLHTNDPWRRSATLAVQDAIKSNEPTGIALPVPTNSKSSNPTSPTIIIKNPSYIAGKTPVGVRGIAESKRNKLDQIISENQRFLR
eukprot:GDKK01060783.1.p1 GENE.GDKK01060783.1~~GDKK01060783.1.p1  ORF type:complete len:683 (+),score=154.47 GDKK01060783.1:299-2050(+)